MADTARMQQPDWPQAWLRQVLAYEPRDLDLFRRALTHRSAGGASNERLEFLGDSVLNLIISDHLFARFAEADEGQLSRLRARVVSAPPLAEDARACSTASWGRLCVPLPVLTSAAARRAARLPGCMREARHAPRLWPAAHRIDSAVRQGHC